MSNGGDTLRSPKLRSRDGIFPFYAGFSSPFVIDVLERYPTFDMIVDPWNGSGTTTTISSSRGRKSIGLDINPAMLIVGKANAATKTDAALAAKLGFSVTRNVEKYQVSGDPLLQWFAPNAAAIIRGLSVGIVGRTVSTARQVQDIPYYKAIALVALFRSCRNLSRTLGTSNPTWTRVVQSQKDKIRATKPNLISEFSHELGRLYVEFGARTFSRKAPPALHVGDARSLPLRSASADLVVTSPPYCTRIDYAMTTALELAILSAFSGTAFRDLRLRSMGSTAVSTQNNEPKPAWGTECVQLLHSIMQHSSKASATYYHKTHVAYFDALYLSLCEVERILRKDGVAVFVVQDSYYKDIHNNLPLILVQMACSAGMDLADRSDFTVKHSMAAVNKAVRSYRGRPVATESVLTFQKRKQQRTTSNPK